MDNAPNGNGSNEKRRGWFCSLKVAIPLFILGCFSLGPGLAYGLTSGHIFVCFSVAGLFVIGLISFLCAIFRAVNFRSLTRLATHQDIGGLLSKLGLSSLPGFSAPSSSSPAKRVVPRPAKRRTTCPNCGASVGKRHVVKAEDLLVVQCPGCDSLYAMEEG